jgi:hypothetical protein
LPAGDGIYERTILGRFILPTPEYVAGSGQREKLDAWLTGSGIGPQAWALRELRGCRYPTQELEEALLRDPAEPSLIVEAIEWTRELLDDDFSCVQMAALAVLAEVESEESVREQIRWTLNMYFSGTTEDFHVDEYWKVIEADKGELLRHCLPPLVRHAYGVLLACCRVRLAICSQDTAEAIGQAINVGIEYCRFWTQLYYGEEVARDRATDRKRHKGSRKGAAGMKARALKKDTEDAPKYQAAVEELMARSRRCNITSARLRVADDEGVPFSRVKSLTVNPSKKTGR